MNCNIEIKAKYNDEIRLVECLTANGLSDTPPIALKQIDTFYKGREGRLKLREEYQSSNQTFTLIGYSRQDSTGPKKSSYTRCQIPKEEVVNLKDILSKTIGIIGTVEKSRDLYNIRDKDSELISRVHIDTVVGLGKFIEFEVMKIPGIDESMMIRFANDLIDSFKIKKEELESCAYMDLLLQKD